jgi:hypothetical protein
MTTRALCETCLWWHPKNQWCKDHSFGDCRVRGPAYSDNGGVWPMTHVGDFCGEHSASRVGPKGVLQAYSLDVPEKPKEPENVVFRSGEIPKEHC